MVINITNIAEKPVFIEGANTTRTVNENTAAGTNIGRPIRATDGDKDELTYSLSGTDAAVFDIDATTGQLRTKLPLDYEIKSSYTVSVSVSDDIHSVDINVVINIINEEERSNLAPVFSEGSSTTRSINENVPIGTNVGAPVSATDLDGDTLTYRLAGSHASRFNIDVTTGQIKTKIPIDYEKIDRFFVSVIVSDGKDSVWIIIRIEVIDLNDPPIFELDSVVFTLPENTPIGQQFGREVSVSEQDGETIDYTFGGNDSSSFSFGGTPAILQTVTAFNYDTKSVYSVTITASDQNGGTDTLLITINILEVGTGVANHAPIFTEGTSTTRSIAENTATGNNLGAAISAIDADEDGLTYSLSGTDADSFSIVSTSGQLQTKDALDFETKSTYSVNVDVTDGILTDQIAVTIEITNANDAPVFATDSVTFSVPEDTPLGTIVGTVSAMDQDGDSLRYQTTGTDDDSFGTDLNSGRVYLLTLSLDYETKTSYSITITAIDRHNASDSIDVTINITDGDEGSGAPALNSSDVQLVNPITTSLLPNYPNPFNPETWIPYQLSKASYVKLTIYNMNGLVVRELALGHQPAGYYQSRALAAYWDGRNNSGEKVSTGVYFCTFKAGDFIATRKMLIRK